MHATDEIFHLIEKARSEGDGVSIEDYQQQIAEVLKELVKRDADAKGQTKKIKEIEQKYNKTATDFQTLLSEHKVQHAQLESANVKNEQLMSEVATLRKKFAALQKEKLKTIQNAQIEKSSEPEKTESQVKIEKEKIAAFDKLQKQYRILEEQMKVKDQRLASVSEKLTQASKKLEQIEEVSEDTKNEPTPKKSKLVKNKPKTKTSTSQTQVINGGEFEKLKKDLDAATKREQLIAKSNEKLLKEIESLKLENESNSKKSELVQRELDNTKAELNHMKKAADKAPKTSVQKVTKPVISTRHAMMQTEKDTKNFGANVHIPVSCPDLNENSSLAKVVKVLALKGNIKDVAFVQKILKRSNEKEIRSIQQQITGYNAANGPNLSVEQVSEPDLHSDGVNDKMLEEILSTFSETLERVGDNIGNMVTNLRESVLSSPPESGDKQDTRKIENKLIALEENASEMVEFAQNIGNLRGGKTEFIQI